MSSDDTVRVVIRRPWQYFSPGDPTGLPREQAERLAARGIVTIRTAPDHPDHDKAMSTAAPKGSPEARAALADGARDGTGGAGDAATDGSHTSHDTRAPTPLSEARDALDDGGYNAMRSALAALSDEPAVGTKAEIRARLAALVEAEEDTG